MEGERESYPITRACVRTLTDKLSRRTQITRISHPINYCYVFLQSFIDETRRSIVCPPTTRLLCRLRSISFVPSDDFHRRKMCKYLAFPLPRGIRCREARDSANFHCRVSSSLAELSYRLRNILMDKILRVLSDRYRKQIIEKNETTKNCKDFSSNGKQTVSFDYDLFYVSQLHRVVLYGGRLFTQGSYDELREFVTNYIHTIVFEEKYEEKELIMSVCYRSPSRVEN